ncbi:uncharacterized protein LOC110721940 [Chenopodium quinoa]|uniref:uncharacterized protein LOC110721940 n=1 Tax=Chenopodium quinoa TaxID=63459 RepID=UPI000B77C732|nr:uncharacterized protein LOC110721940 [Chenopodium quinoa]
MLLHYRHLLDSATCPWCDREMEPTSHAIFYSQRVSELWDDCGCAGAKLQPRENWCELLVRWKELGLRIKQRAAYLAWIVWAERNYKVYSGTSTPNDIVATRARKLADEYGTYSEQVYSVTQRRPKRSSSRWNAPPPGRVKLNSDASLYNEGWIGMGVVARDKERKVLFAATWRVKVWWPPEIAKGKALLMAMRLARRFGYEDVILESDCQTLITRLSKGVVYLSDLDGVLEDILSISCEFKSFIWSHVKRDGNYVAHHLAKLMSFGVEQVWVNHCPDVINPYVFSDNLSLN